MMEQGLLDTDGKKIAVSGLLDTGAEVSITSGIEKIELHQGRPDSDDFKIGSR